MVRLGRRISAEDLREGLGAVGKQMDKESVKKLALELDVSGCGSINLEVRRSTRSLSNAAGSPCTHIV